MFVLSQCDFCSPAWRFCTTASCKGPIVKKEGAVNGGGVKSSKSPNQRSHCNFLAFLCSGFCPHSSQLHFPPLAYALVIKGDCFQSMGIFRPTLLSVLPFSWASLTELCSFWYGLKDLFLLHKLDEMLKLITSQAVEGMWIRTGGYGQFRGKWVKFIVFILKYILISFSGMCRLDQLTHTALWNLKPENQLNRLYLQ